MICSSSEEKNISFNLTKLVDFCRHAAHLEYVTTKFCNFFCQADELFITSLSLTMFCRKKATKTSYWSYCHACETGPWFSLKSSFGFSNNGFLLDGQGIKQWRTKFSKPIDNYFSSENSVLHQQQKCYRK